MRSWLGTKGLFRLGKQIMQFCVKSHESTVPLPCNSCPYVMCGPQNLLLDKVTTPCIFCSRIGHYSHILSDAHPLKFLRGISSFLLVIFCFVCFVCLFVCLFVCSCLLSAYLQVWPCVYFLSSWAKFYEVQTSVAILVSMVTANSILHLTMIIRNAVSILVLAETLFHRNACLNWQWIGCK